jgi:glycosyltransferase involved in cell wall biosynthesis
VPHGRDRGGVVPELEDGAVVAPDPEALAAALSEVFGDEDARRRMGSTALRLARERFSLETTVAGFRALYDELSLAGRGSKGQAMEALG